MEFTIDLELVKRILEEEGWVAAQDVGAFGPMRAYQQSMRRHDERIAQAADVNTLACKSGCSWCCHFSVDVRAVEALNIAEFVEREFSLRDKLQLKAEITTNARLLAGMDEEQRARINVKCAFLHEGRCRIYPVRPQTCRNYHATDVAGCKQAFEQPENDDIAPEYAPLVYQSGGAHVDAFSAAMGESGYDVAVYEMNAAVLQVLNSPKEVSERFLSRGSAFAGLTGTEAPMEFLDLADEQN